MQELTVWQMAEQILVSQEWVDDQACCEGVAEWWHDKATQALAQPND